MGRVLTMLVAGLILVGAVPLGMSAFTTADIDRQADVNVVADQQGLLSLTDGSSGNLVYQNSNDQLAIDFTDGSAGGANTDALFRLGDPNDVVNSQAFIVANNDDEDHQINAAYTGSDAVTAEDNLRFEVYDSSGTSVGTISASGTNATWSAAQNTEYYVVITVDTGHSADLVAASEDLSGTMEFTIDDVVDSAADGGTQTQTSSPSESNTPVSLAIDQINADAAGDDRENLNNEFIVFANTGGTELDLSGYMISDAVGHSYTIPGGVTLAPGETLTLHTGSGTVTGTDLYFGSGSPIWNNGGDTITLTAPDGTVVLEESYA